MTPAHRRHRARLLAAGALLAPFVVVQAGRMAGTSLTPSSAGMIAPLVPDSGTPAARPAPPTPRQTQALEWSRDYAGPVTSRSPVALAQAAAPVPVAAPTPPGDEPPEPTPTSPVSGMRVNTIMGHDENGLAVIDGKVHRLGDELVPGWKLTTINARDRFVEITGPGDERVRLELGT